MMFKKALVYSLILLIVGCTDDPISIAKEAVSESLKDPSSARFKNIFVVKQVEGTTTITYVCGIVDGKNGFGAYTGGTRFVAWGAYLHKDNFHVDIDNYDVHRPSSSSKSNETIFEQIYWNKSCVDEIHRPMYTAKPDRP